MKQKEVATALWGLAVLGQRPSNELLRKMVCGMRDEASTTPQTLSNFLWVGPFPVLRCRANMALMRQSRPDSGRGVQVKVLKTFFGVSSSLGSGPVARSPLLSKCSCRRGFWERKFWNRALPPIVSSNGRAGAGALSRVFGDHLRVNPPKIRRGAIDKVNFSDFRGNARQKWRFQDSTSWIAFHNCSASNLGWTDK